MQWKQAGSRCATASTKEESQTNLNRNHTKKIKEHSALLKSKRPSGGALCFYASRDKVFFMSIRMRHTRGHTGNRRSHHALHETNIVKDKESGNLRLPHRVDEVTGMYRGKQIFTPRVKGERSTKVKGPSTEPNPTHTHEHAHEVHANAEAKGLKGIFGKVATGGRPKARSGFGGGA
jgi:large subunit ribosomal protein L32